MVTASASSLTPGSPTRNDGKKPGTSIKTPAMNYGSFSFEARRKEQQAGLAAREARLSMLEAVVVEQEELLDPWSDYEGLDDHFGTTRLRTYIH